MLEKPRIHPIFLTILCAGHPPDVYFSADSSRFGLQKGTIWKYQPFPSGLVASIPGSSPTVMDNSKSPPIVKDLVLVGGGHSHVTVLKRFGMKPLPGVRLTLICRDVHTPYSGMLPGLVAGHYDFDEAHIDLGPLSQFAGARLFHDEVVGLDLDQRLVLCKSRPPVSFDVLSINIGSTPSLVRVPGATEHVVPVKPINRFMARWESLKERVRSADKKLSMATVGAGAGGVELTLAVQFALRKLLADEGRSDLLPDFHIFSASPDILPTHNEKVRRKFVRVLGERQVNVYTNKNVAEFRDGALLCSDGEEMSFDEVLWVTQAGAAEWLNKTGLELDEGGFIRVHATLESTSHPDVFAAGDIAAVVPHPREKSGVFAVRQGKPLEKNLRRALENRALKPFRPQKKFLSLISTGEKYAIASRGNWSIEGRNVWRWKNWIDQHFMDKFNGLPGMRSESSSGLPEGLASPEAIREISTAAMRCAGCGSKVGSTVLNRVLNRIETEKRDDILIGLKAPDDAAVFEVPEGKLLVQTVDAFRAIVDDPYVFGKITAHHCLGDVFAMGGNVHSALVVASIPFGLEEKIEETLEHLLRGVVEVLDHAGAALMGGHTSEGAELSLGLAVNGLVDRDSILRKSGMREGDLLVLTKALGTGTLFAANMRLRAKGRWISNAITSMLQSSQDASGCLMRHGASACTDVTGFGLLGHLAEMTRASKVSARVDLSSLPVLDGARETLAMGIVSSLQPQNIRLRRAIENLDAISKDSLYPLLFDPQTSGGLLASVPANQAEACVKELRSLGCTEAAVIGEAINATESGTIRIESSCQEVAADFRR